MVSEGFDEGADGVASGEAIFAMDPQAVIWALARQLVRGQSELASFRRAADAAQRVRDTAPEAVETYLVHCAGGEKTWYTETLPMLTASMRLALEVYDTFGPGRIEIADPTEAAIWNNKHHVWFTELSGQPRPDA
ncbi:MAG: hypothetical protein AB1925_18660 [Actinomycetota bacterium]